jgi:hypothetical protein
MPPTWYVTVEVKTGTLPKSRHPRLTTTFENESEAKCFARAKLREGQIVFAGTINPFLPRQHVPSHKIAAWVDEEQP